MTQERKHFPQSQFAISGNELMVAGQSVTSIKEKLGATPFFVYDSQVIKQNIDNLRSKLPARLELAYAIKANPNAELVSRVADWTDALDVSSLRELKGALSLGLKPDKISFAGPGKSIEELTFAIDNHVLLNVESPTELTRCIDISKTLGKRAQICIRVNPQLELRGSGMKMSGEGSPFGIDADQVGSMLKTFPLEAVDMLGFHVFGCSQILSASNLNNYYREVFKILQQLQSDLPQPMKLLNLGGGFGIPYFPGEQPLDILEVGDELARLMTEYSAMLSEATVRMEFGRYLVGNAGLYISEISDIKESGGRIFAVVNGGMHHHLANSGNLGQVLRRNYPVAIANKMAESDMEEITIVGPLCTPLDLVAHKVRLPAVEIGDLVAVYNSGAYGLSASPVNFLGHALPLEVLL